MDIIVTTPKSQMKAAAQEAADVIAAGGGEYFRRFSRAGCPSCLFVGDRVWYVEDGYLRGSCAITRTARETRRRTCDTTGRTWAPGYYVFMDATTWQWITPIPIRGFQGFHYFGDGPLGDYHCLPDGTRRDEVEVVGGWLDPKPIPKGQEATPCAT